MRFSDKVVIITGSGSGIGRATAVKIASEGGQIIVADYSETNGLETERLITKSGGKAKFIRTDISKSEEIEILVKLTVKEFGKIDVVINNAAIMTFAPICEIDVTDWDRVMNTNLRSVFLMTKFALPYMNKGAFVNVSSVHAHETTPNNSPYATSKGGIEAFTRAMSLEVESTRVRFNCVAPGAVNTPMLWNNPNVKSGKEKITGRIAEPDEIANAISFLASSDASFINGTTLIVDAGRLDVL